MFDKKAQDLSINFLVKFILAVVIFGLGVILMWNIFYDSTSTAELTQGAFDRRIAALNCNPNDLVCISSNRFALRAGENVLIEMKLQNSFNQELEFNIKMEIRNSNNSVVIGDGATIADHMTVLPLQYSNEVVEARSSKDFPFLVSTTRRAIKGMYVARIEIENSGCSDNCLPTEIKRIQFEVT